MKAPHGFSLVMLEGTVGMVLGAAYGIICARFWGPEFSGIASLAATIASLFAFISCLSMEQIVVARYVSKERHDVLFMATVFIRSLAICLSACGVWLSSSNMEMFTGAWMLLPSLVFFQAAISAFDLWRLRAQAMSLLHLQVKPRLLIVGIFFLAKSASVMLQPAQISVWLVVWLSVIESALLVAVSIFVTRNRAPLHIDLPLDWPIIKLTCKDILSASLPLFAAGVVVMLFFKLDYFLLGEMSTTRDLGLYASAMRVMEMYVGIGGIALSQLFPVIARQHTKGPTEYEAALRSTFRLAYAMAIGIVAFNFLFGEALILFLLGSQYTEVARYSTVFCLLAVPLLSGTVRGFAISLEALHINHFYSAVLGFAISVPLLFYLIPRLGFRGALIADMCAYVASAMLSSLVLPSLRGIAKLQWRPGFVDAK